MKLDGLSLHDPANLDDGLSQLLRLNGVPENMIEQQLIDLNELISLGALNALLRQRPPAKRLASDDEVAAYIQSNFTSQDIQAALVAQAEKYLSDYLATIDGQHS